MKVVTAREVAAALEITRAAYQEAMTRAGMLAGKIAEVHVYAESQLAELAAQDDGVEPGTYTPLGGGEESRSPSHPAAVRRSRRGNRLRSTLEVVAMTIAPEKTAVAVRDPRDLVPTETFHKLVKFMVTRHRVTERYAERVIEQTLVYLKAVSDNPTIRIVPDISVDPGWHCFIEHTYEYAEFCERVAGRFIHHVPIMIEDISSGAAMARTIPALHATGYPVDMEFWSTGETCCPENPCV